MGRESEGGWENAWYKDGKLHRTDGPAIDNNDFSMWYTDGVCTKKIRKYILCKKCQVELAYYGRTIDGRIVWGCCIDCIDPSLELLIEVGYEASDPQTLINKKLFLAYHMECELKKRQYINDELNEYAY